MIEHELRTTQRTTEIVHITNDETGEAQSYTLTNEPTSAVVYTDQLHEATAARIIEHLQQEIVPVPEPSRLTALKISGFFGVILAASPPIDTIVKGNERLISLKESLVYGGVFGAVTVGAIMGFNEFILRVGRKDTEASNEHLLQEIELVRGSVAQTSVAEQ